MNKEQFNQYLPNILNSLYSAVDGNPENINIVCDESALNTYYDCARIATKYDEPTPTSEQVGNVWKTLFRQEKNYLHNTKQVYDSELMGKIIEEDRVKYSDKDWQEHLDRCFPRENNH